MSGASGSGAAASAAQSSKQHLMSSHGCRQHPPVRVLAKLVKSKRARVRHASTPLRAGRGASTSTLLVSLRASLENVLPRDGSELA